MDSEQEMWNAIDRMLIVVRRTIQDFSAADIHVAGAAIREFLLDAGQGFVDALICVNGRATVIEV